MGLQINWGSINSKIENAQTKNKKNVERKKIEKIEERAATAAEDFRNILASNAYNLLPPNVARAVDPMGGTYIGSPFPIGGGRVAVEGMIFGGTRPSLRPEVYGYVYDMAELYNYGVDHTMKKVYGMWHGIDGVGSKTEIPATHFIEAAAREFLATHADDGAVDVIIQRSF